MIESVGMITIRHAEAAEDMEIIRRLFREYEAWTKTDLCFQGFEEELATLPGKYARPGGRLLIAEYHGSTAGCVALRPLQDEICEMKRLFVRENFRRSGIGRYLITEIIEEAKKSGYKKIRLDTRASKMQAAVAIYRDFGFYEIPPYYENPLPDVIYMEKSLIVNTITTK